MGMAGVAGVGVLAAEGESGTTNFLIPNGTFFYVLAIFLIVFGVIAKFVVPPVQKVLNERERMVAETAQDNRQASEQEAAAETDYRNELSSARAEAGSIRDAARADGRQAVDAWRAEANGEVAGRMEQANAELQAEGAALAPTLETSAETLAETLASRVLGVDPASSGSSTRTAGQ